MITPKPTTVVELFTGHPERWKKHSSFGNKYMDYPCCIFGAIQIVYGEWKERQALPAWDNFCKCMDMSPNLVFNWNDAPERTFEEVLAKCIELGI